MCVGYKYILRRTRMDCNSSQDILCKRNLEMPNSDIHHSTPDNEHTPDRSRRDFLLLVPLTLCAGIAATIVAAALRFLSPAKAATQEAVWTDVAPVSQLLGETPMMHSVTVEHRAGWANALQEHVVYVLPHSNGQVLSAVCPHEGCNVAWQDDAKNFACPCHDSAFAPDGARLTGPSRRGLDPLPTRVQNGILQVQHQTFANNTAERTVRG